MNREFLKILLADRDNIHIFSTSFLRFSNFWNKNCHKTICMEIDQMKWVELSKEKRSKHRKKFYRLFSHALPGKWNFIFKDFPFSVKILFKYNKNLYWLVIYNHCSFMRILRGTIFPLPFPQLQFTVVKIFTNDYLIANTTLTFDIKVPCIKFQNHFKICPN